MALVRGGPECLWSLKLNAAPLSNTEATETETKTKAELNPGAKTKLSAHDSLLLHAAHSEKNLLKYILKLKKNEFILN